MSVQRLEPLRLHGLRFDVAGASERGPRPENQDAFVVGDFERTGVVAVADGMGGERAGRVAADVALGAVLSAAPIRSVDAARHAARAADEAVARAAREDPAAREGMGCALALLSLAADRGGDLGWVVAHVGDVRVLSRAPDGTVRLETRDHTPAFARWEAGEVGLDEIPDTPGANRLQRAVGRGGEADAAWIPLRRGWSYAILSDGVTKAMRLDELGDALALPSAADAVEAVRRKVQERGPDDNFTVVAVRITDADGAAGPVPADEATDPAAVPADATAPQPRPVAAPRAAPVFDPDDAVTRSRRTGPWGPAALLLALLALGLGGFALWTAWQARDAAVPAAEVEALRTRLDSVQAALAAPDTTAPDSLAGLAAPDTASPDTIVPATP